MDRIGTRKNWLESKIGELSPKLDELSEKLFDMREELSSTEERVVKMNVELGMYRGMLANVVLVEMGYAIGSKVMAKSWDMVAEKEATIVSVWPYSSYMLIVDCIYDDGRLDSLPADNIRHI